jgi:hydrogenase nickel incorporation protein HypA/HybF
MNFYALFWRRKNSIEMHELSIAQEIVDIVNQHLPKGESNSVRSVKIAVGKMASILNDSLMFCFEAITANTNLQGTKLNIENIPLVVLCTDCNEKSELEDTIFVCPKCNGFNLKILRGMELNVIEIEFNDK